MTGATTGTWFWTDAAGYQSDGFYNPAGSGANRATWTFPLRPGREYDVSATWLAYWNRASNAPYTFRDGAAEWTVAADQTLPPQADGYLVAADAGPDAEQGHGRGHNGGTQQQFAPALRPIVSQGDIGQKGHGPTAQGAHLPGMDAITHAVGHGRAVGEDRAKIKQCPT